MLRCFQLRGSPMKNQKPKVVHDRMTLGRHDAGAGLASASLLNTNEVGRRPLSSSHRQTKNSHARLMLRTVDACWMRQPVADAIEDKEAGCHTVSKMWTRRAREGFNFHARAAPSFFLDRSISSTTVPNNHTPRGANSRGSRRS